MPHDQPGVRRLLALFALKMVRLIFLSVTTFVEREGERERETVLEVRKRVTALNTHL